MLFYFITMGFLLTQLFQTLTKGVMRYFVVIFLHNGLLGHTVVVYKKAQ